jgi:hypothetical protein
MHGSRVSAATVISESSWSYEVVRLLVSVTETLVGQLHLSISRCSLVPVNADSQDLYPDNTWNNSTMQEIRKGGPAANATGKEMGTFCRVYLKVQAQRVRSGR